MNCPRCKSGTLGSREATLAFNTYSKCFDCSFQVYNSYCNDDKLQRFFVNDNPLFNCVEWQNDKTFIYKYSELLLTYNGILPYDVSIDRIEKMILLK